MTKKDYIMLARIIGEAWVNGDQVHPDHIKASLVIELARELHRDNPNFDKYRFETAIKKARVGA